MIDVERRAGGTLLLHGEPLGPHAQSLLALLDAAAERTPDRPFLVEHDARDVWRQATFATVALRSHRVGAALRSLGASTARPVLILSGNGIDHAMITFGALRAAIPVVPVGAQSGLSAHDGFARLRAIAARVDPAVVFARDGGAYASAVRAVFPDAAFVAVTEPPAGKHAYDYARLLSHAPLLEPPRVDGTTVAKIIFTSGSTGEPKGVRTTHGMICAMLQAIAQAWPFLDDHPPTVVDWLPWSHCYGGNKVLGIVLRCGGTLYIDDGSPTPARYERTVRLRSQVAPTLAFDVPLGWKMWVERLRADDGLRRRWLARLDLASWGGAPLAPATFDALRAMGARLGAGWGSTETSPTVALTPGAASAPDAIGVPVAGVALKLVPAGDAYEARVRGPQVMPGYDGEPERTAAAFDEEGFYRIGDVVRPLDARAPERGLAFTARVDERFKLSSGTWVGAARLRDAFLAACPDAADAVVTGDGRDEVGMLVFPQHHAPHGNGDALRAAVLSALRSIAVGDGSAGRPRRALIVTEPAARDERTEKGTLVRRTVLARRAALVARLHASIPDADVILS